MSKFVSYKPGTVINGDGSKSDATIFVDEQGNESSVVAGSPIEKLLLEEMGVVSQVAPTQDETVGSTSDESASGEATETLALPAAGESTASQDASNDSGSETIVA